MPAQSFEIPLINGQTQRPFINPANPINYDTGVGVTPLPCMAAGMVNFVGEKTGIIKRPSLIPTYQLATFPLDRPSGVSSENINYWISGGILYLRSSSIGFVGGGVVASAPIGGSYPIFLIVSDGGGHGYTYVGGVLSPLIDTVFNALRLAAPNAACLDGTFYVMDNTGAIYGSKSINDPTIWDATNVINAWSEPSGALGVYSYRNYILAFKTNGMDFFYDAANAIGSPLLPLTYLHSDFGCTQYDSIAKVGACLFWMGTINGEELVICSLDNTTITDISTPDILRAIRFDNPLMVAFSGCAINFYGHLCYCLTSGYSSVAGFSGRSYVYDTITGLWQVFLFPPGVGVPRLSLGTQTSTAFSEVVTDTGVVYRLTDESFVDIVGTDSFAISGEVLTEKFTAGTNTTKVMKRLTIHTDRAHAGVINVAWSDDDMVSWTNWQEILLDNPLTELWDLGSFVQRQFRFRHSSPTPIRIQRVEALCSVGST
jgi:hypothetical protein